MQASGCVYGREHKIPDDGDDQSHHGHRPNAHGSRFHERDGGNGVDDSQDEQHHRGSTQFVRYREDVVHHFGTATDGQRNKGEHGKPVQHVRILGWDP